MDELPMKMVMLCDFHEFSTSILSLPQGMIQPDVQLQVLVIMSCLVNPKSS